MPKKVTNVLSHWHHLIGNLQYPPQEFYSALEAAIQRREIPGSRFSRVDYLEGGMLSAKREYMRIERKDLVFDVCAAPFGNGFFISWWLGEALPRWGIIVAAGAMLFTFLAFAFLINSLGLGSGLIASLVIVPALFFFLGYLINEGTIPIDHAYMIEIPVVGRIYNFIFHPATYYRIDTAQMFQEAVRSAVLEVIDELVKVKGLRALSESDRKPVMEDLRRK